MTKTGFAVTASLMSRRPWLRLSSHLVNIPHRIFKVSGVGEMHVPKRASAWVDARYQSVQIIAAYDKADLAN